MGLLARAILVILVLDAVSFALLRGCLVGNCSSMDPKKPNGKGETEYLDNGCPAIGLNMIMRPTVRLLPGQALEGVHPFPP